MAECLLVRMCVSGGACYPECTCQNALLTGKNVHVCESMLTGENVHVCESMLTDKNVQAKGVFTGNSVGGWGWGGGRCSLARLCVPRTVAHGKECACLCCE